MRWMMLLPSCPSSWSVPILGLAPMAFKDAYKGALKELVNNIGLFP